MRGQFAAITFFSLWSLEVERLCGRGRHRIREIDHSRVGGHPGHPAVQPVIEVLGVVSLKNDLGIRVEKIFLFVNGR